MEEREEKKMYAGLFLSSAQQSIAISTQQNNLKFSKFSTPHGWNWCINIKFP